MVAIHQQSTISDLLAPPYTFFLLNGDIELNRNEQLFV